MPEGLSKTLWEENMDIAMSCLNHPFVRGIASGNLPKDRFNWYVGQDYFYLQAFAKAFCLAVVKAPDVEGMKAFHELAGGALGEMSLHIGFEEKLGANVKAVIPSRATRMYTDFLLATAWERDAGLIAAATTPCNRLYAWLGQNLMKGANKDNPYIDWILTYSSKSFEELAQKTEMLIDRYAKDDDITRSIYRYAMICEYEFFDAAWKHD
ncbi:MAG TPA: TenA family protein [Acetomicrobium flavidum]|uniref:Thiaminase /4-amino-5-aminomethyl-2-methylpyrimidine deaminase n=2 Tax=Acetomicrobium TaxID=49894 RepID=A0ABY1JDE8_9BACT|nr:TenA family protein [Acetomicrobium mobile]SIN68517.1 thiaminase /4-amino-5-aminomethyl-2-methylpyrimidine deaminase [Acetomicrobium flavidum]AFM22633.1 putative transcription activator [Acetomicrobium mobile DSM 13181]HOM31463.1 TenA family protein [Acetomicrobium flavidum]HOP87586.1 TenA family protein [Acetomicrobium flavidum]HPU68847.1 TenA family protein [Acetomicrobium flavidum]